MSITRRLFLRHTAAAGIVGAVAAPAVAAEPEMTPRERAIWHLRELERLILADGASEATILACGHSYGGIRDLTGSKSIALHPDGRVIDVRDMFAEEGGARHG